MARPGKYEYWLTEEGLTLLRGWARHGFTNEQIAKDEDKMNIAPSTFYEWMKRFPELSEAVKKKKRVYDFEVEEAAQRSGTGYYVWEEDQKRDENGEMVTVARRKRWIKPEPMSQKFWLKNRMKDDCAIKLNRKSLAKTAASLIFSRLQMPTLTSVSRS
jgi:hypothetical protein